MESEHLVSQLPGRSRQGFGALTKLAGVVGLLWIGVSNGLSADEPARSTNAVSGRSLCEKHCVGCHGQDGAGDGPAVRYVYPLPRNLRRDRYNIVSNSSRIASREDITRVLRDGMPGTAMKPFREALTSSELRAVVDEVLSMRNSGARDAYLEHCQVLDETPDEAEARKFIEQRTLSSATLAAPEFSDGGRGAVARGRQLFHQQGCPSCHGLEGTGAADVALKDQAGSPLRARDLVREPFKGGHDDEAVYHRIRFGFPGGPMPEHANLTEAEFGDLVAYVQSLSREPKWHLRTYEMRRYAARGLYRAELGNARKAER